jgi:hypothetical protein
MNDDEKREKKQRQNEAKGLKRAMKEQRKKGVDSFVKRERADGSAEITETGKVSTEVAREKYHEMIEECCHFLSVGVDNEVEGLNQEEWEKKPSFHTHAMVAIIRAPPEVSFYMLARALQLVDEQIRRIVEQHIEHILDDWKGPLPPEDMIEGLGYMAAYSEVIKRLEHIEKQSGRGVSFFTKLFKMKDEVDEKMDPWRRTIMFGSEDDVLLRFDEKKLKDEYNLEVI